MILGHEALVWPDPDGAMGLSFGVLESGRYA